MSISLYDKYTNSYSASAGLEDFYGRPSIIDSILTTETYNLDDREKSLHAQWLQIAKTKSDFKNKQACTQLVHQLQSPETFAQYVESQTDYYGQKAFVEQITGTVTVPVIPSVAKLDPKLAAQMIATLPGDEAGSVAQVSTRAASEYAGYVRAEQAERQAHPMGRRIGRFALNMIPIFGPTMSDLYFINPIGIKNFWGTTSGRLLRSIPVIGWILGLYAYVRYRKAHQETVVKQVLGIHRQQEEQDPQLVQEQDVDSRPVLDAEFEAVKVESQLVQVDDADDGAALEAVKVEPQQPQLVQVDDADDGAALEAETKVLTPLQQCELDHQREIKSAIERLESTLDLLNQDYEPQYNDWVSTIPYFTHPEVVEGLTIYCNLFEVRENFTEDYKWLLRRYGIFPSEEELKHFEDNIDKEPKIPGASKLYREFINLRDLPSLSSSNAYNIQLGQQESDLDVDDDSSESSSVDFRQLHSLKEPELGSLDYLREYYKQHGLSPSEIDELVEMQRQAFEDMDIGAGSSLDMKKLEEHTKRHPKGSACVLGQAAPAVLERSSRKGKEAIMFGASLFSGQVTKPPSSIPRSESSVDDDIFSQLHQFSLAGSESSAASRKGDVFGQLHKSSSEGTESLDTSVEGDVFGQLHKTSLVGADSSDTSVEGDVFGQLHKPSSVSTEGLNTSGEGDVFGQLHKPSSVGTESLDTSVEGDVFGQLHKTSLVGADSSDTSVEGDVFGQLHKSSSEGTESLNTSMEGDVFGQLRQSLSTRSDGGSATDESLGSPRNGGVFDQLYQSSVIGSESEDASFDGGVFDALHSLSPARSGGGSATDESLESPIKGDVFAQLRPSLSAESENDSGTDESLGTDRDDCLEHCCKTPLGSSVSSGTSVDTNPFDRLHLPSPNKLSSLTLFSQASARNIPSVQEEVLQANKASVPC